jgi:ABC-type nitrate/sulfonate/bicarbonate transport system substrate-binding protein
MFVSFLRNSVRVAVVALAIVSLFVTSNNARAADNAAPPKLSVSDVTIVVPFVLNIPRAGFDAAVKLDAFKKEGLNVKIAHFADYGDIVSAIVGNPNSFGWGSSSLIRAVQGQNAPVREIAMASTFFPYQFWSRGDSGITSLKDLRGKRILTARQGDLIDIVWVEALKSVGIPMTDVTRVVGFDGVGALLAKTADAANLDAGALGKARQAHLRQIFDYNKLRKDQGFDPNAGVNLGWGTSLELINNHPDTVKAFLRALVTATVKLREDRDFGISVLTSDPYGMDAQAAAEAYDELRYKWIVRMDPAHGDYDWDLQKVAIDTMGVPKEKIDRAHFVDTKLIGEVLSEMHVTF